MKKIISIILLLFILIGCGATQPVNIDDNSSAENSSVDSVESKQEVENTNSSEESSVSSTPTQNQTPSNIGSTSVWCKEPPVSVDRLHPIVIEARKHLGNVNGDLFWQWYGFNSYTAWCAAFVSYCAYQTDTNVPRFAWVPNGVNYFKNTETFRYRDDYVPKSGDIIFFQYEGFSEAGHVGVVECVVDNVVYTIEGNWNNSCQRAKYPLSWKTILGYGII